MKSKSRKTTKPKVMDVTRAKKTASASTTGESSRRLVIQSRPIMAADSPTGNGDEQSEPATAPTLPPSKKVIVPISVDGSEKPEVPKQAPLKEEPKEVPEQPSKAAAADPAPASPTKAVEGAPKKVADADPEPEPEEAEEQAPAATTPDAGDDESGDGTKPSPETQKAVEEAAKAAEREQEIESYIDKRQFFVPIDSVARKRSVKVSAGLTVIVLLLAVVLIDLMLDSGLILLVQKIPHTHFFTANSSLNQ